MPRNRFKQKYMASEGVFEFDPFNNLANYNVDAEKVSIHITQH